MGVRDYPAIDPSIISVQTTYTGAAADIIENQITEPLEKAVNAIQGIRTISSTSSTGSSQITIEFNLGVNLDNAANDVRDKVNTAVRNLPQDIDAPPVVSKADANSDPILFLAINSRTKSLLELSDYAENILQDRFQTIDNVSAVNLFGLKRKAMRIWLDPNKMNAYNVSFTDINQIIAAENIDLPAGKLVAKNQEFILNSFGRLRDEEEFRQLILRDDDNGTIRLRDVARVEIGPEVEEQQTRANCIPAVVLAIVPQPGANYIEIADEFYKRLDDIKRNSKADFQLTVGVDNTKIIRNSIEEVKETLIISLGLVVLVILAFFRSILVAFRPLIDIPISLIATFFIMYICGFSINILTMLAIVLATGLVVDDGIVVTENIFRKLEMGMPIKQAALEGSKEIFFPVLATSITLAIVFMPVIFLQGFVGSLFKEFGVALSAAVLISCFVSLTITPVLNVLLTPKPKKGQTSHGHGKFYVATEPFFVGLENGYRFILNKFLKIKWIAVPVLMINLFLIYYFQNHLQSELAPLEDRSSIRISLLAAEGTNFDKSFSYSKQIENYLYDSIPERFKTISITPGIGGSGSNSAYFRLNLIPPNERIKSQNQVALELGAKFKAQYPDLKVFPIQEQTISVGTGSRVALPVQFVVQTLDFDKLKKNHSHHVRLHEKQKIFQVSMSI